MIGRIEEILKSATEEIVASSDPRALDQIRVKYLGRKGRLTEILREIGSLSPEERPAVGKAAGQAKTEIGARIKARSSELERRPEAEAFFDVTMPGRRPVMGGLHPLTLITEEIVEIFHGMGFSIADGPEMETEYYNFDALNTPEDHPARDVQDTFYLENGELLRTQTSPVQIRVMEKTRPPVRVIAPGRCSRRDAVDATHHFVFHQIEGLYVDRSVTFGDLKGTISCFARHLLGEKVKVRFRPDFFPFTEPSAEYAFSCVLCEGGGCRVCKGTGWVEVSGAGMVDPEVLKVVDYDPEVYTGFAFGMGVARIAMMMYGIDDIRLFLDNDLRFISQF